MVSGPVSRVLAATHVFVAESSFSILGNMNAVPSGDHSTEKSLEACQAQCTGMWTQFSYNVKSGHCFLSNSSTWSADANPRVTSGCDMDRVEGCPAVPVPGPEPPVPVPAPTPGPSPAPAPGGGGPFNSHWFANRKATNLTVDGDTLTWTGLQDPDTIVTYLPEPFLLANDGDVAAVRLNWESDGEDGCPSSDWANHGFCKDDDPCMRHSIHCLAGTGDFRIGFLHENGAGRVNASGWAETTSYSGMNKALESPPFSGYRGYSLRIFPHVSTKAEHYTPKNTSKVILPYGTAVPCSFNWNGLKYPTRALSKERLSYHGCFEAPAGKWTDLLFRVTRISGTQAQLEMSMNGISYTHMHTMSSKESERFPKQIDTIVIEFANPRSYGHVRLAPYSVAATTVSV